jgi:dinuclear metal center YbgI/SA1388 family protein
MTTKMKGKRTACIQDLVGLVNRLFPTGLAEDWDNVGLQVGDPNETVKRAMIALDPTSKVVEKAVESKCQALITHHPLIFHPLKKVVSGTEVGNILFHAIQNHLALVAAHTNLDRARNGLNDWLAGRLKLNNIKPFETKKGELFKLIAYVPSVYGEDVANALFAAGAGHVGKYDQCSFRTFGQGSFRPGPESSPFAGEPGRLERVEELRLEVIVPRENTEPVVRKLLQAHPYEEVAYDLIPLENVRQDLGLGRIGRLTEEMSLATFVEHVKEKLEAPLVRLVAGHGQRISKVAVCGGSGGSLIGEAVRQGVDALVTGDVKYHEARSVEAQGLAVVDAGHFHTEKWMIPSLTEKLAAEAEKLGYTITFLPMNQEKDPFRIV